MSIVYGVSEKLSLLFSGNYEAEQIEGLIGRRYAQMTLGRAMSVQLLTILNITIFDGFRPNAASK